MSHSKILDEIFKTSPSDKIVWRLLFDLNNSEIRDISREQKRVLIRTLGYYCTNPGIRSEDALSAICVAISILVAISPDKGDIFNHLGTIPEEYE